MPFVNQRLSRFRPLLPVALVFSLAVATWLPQLLTLHPVTSYPDEGIVAQAARRLVNGEWPYRDFFSFYPPLTALWYGLFLLLFGETFWALRLGVFATSLLIMLLATWVALRLTPRDSSAALMAISFLGFFGGPYWFVASHHWLSLLLCLWSFALLLPDAEESTPSPRRVFWAGVAGGATALVIQHKGLLWLLAVSAVLAFVPREARRSLLIRFWLGVAVAVLPLALLFVAVVGWQPLFEQLVMALLHGYRKVHGSPDQTPMFKQLWDSWRNLGAAWPGAGAEGFTWFAWGVWALGFAGRTLVHLLPLFGLIGLAWLWRRRFLPNLTLALLAAFLVANYLATFHRLHETTLVFAGLSAVFVLALSAWLAREGGGMPGGRLFASLWVGLFLAIALGFMLRELVPGHIPNRLPAGTVNTLYAGEAEELTGFDAFLRQHRHPDDQVFCVSGLPMLYYLFALDNPTPYEGVDPNSDPQVQEQVVQILEAKQIRWVVSNRYVGGALGRYLHNRYQEKEQFGTLRIAERLPGPERPPLSLPARFPLKWPGSGGG